MNLDLSGKRALVGGSTQGIGLAAAKELAALGASVTLLARNENSLQMALQSLPVSKQAKHDYLVADFSKINEVEAVVKKYAEKNTVHIIVNNTGGPPAGPVNSATTHAFIDAFQAHVLVNQLLMQTFLAGMKAEQYGRIINVISTSVKAPLKNLGVSNSIRAAVANWAKTLANEVGEFGITVNNVLPGATNTARLQAIVENQSGKFNKTKAEVEADMKHEIPAKRFGEAHEVAAAIAFLATPAAAYINGINLPVDGGRTPNL